MVEITEMPPAYQPHAKPLLEEVRYSGHKPLTKSDVLQALTREGVNEETVQNFLLFHASNPNVWREFERLALSSIRSGITKWSAKGIAEVVRWTLAVEKTGTWKVNNNYISYYARCFILKYPEHSEFFEFREVRGVGR